MLELKMKCSLKSVKMIFELVATFTYNDEKINPRNAFIILKTLQSHSCLFSINCLLDTNITIYRY